MKRFALPIVALALLIGGGLALGQTYFQTPAGNVIAGGQVDMCLNSAGQATANTAYPCGATPVTASATGTTGAVTATLPAVAGKTTYLCTVLIGEAGSGTATATATNTVTGTLNFVVVAPGNFSVPFNPCVPANAANVTIPVATAANATATAVAVTATGFQL
jgi:hypothetical protein